MSRNHTPREDYEAVCGETYDHDAYVHHQDEDTTTWWCHECGAEWWEDVVRHESAEVAA